MRPNIIYPTICRLDNAGIAPKITSDNREAKGEMEVRC